MLAELLLLKAKKRSEDCFCQNVDVLTEDDVAVKMSTEMSDMLFSKKLRIFESLRNTWMFFAHNSTFAEDYL